jgi:cephalosporin-C deacetylase-like acetyl esterase
MAGCLGGAGTAPEASSPPLPAPPAHDAAFDAEAFWAMPTNVPFSTSVLYRGQDEDANWQGVMFTSEIYRGQPMRIFAWYAWPKGEGPFPAVLAIHGAGEDADLPLAREFARSGYACLSMDWNAFNEAGPRWVEGDPLPACSNTVYCGIWYPDWPGHFYLPAEDGDWTWCALYRGAMAARRGLEWLEKHEEIDAERLAVEGRSFGGLLAQLVTGLDPRVKAAVSSAGADSWTSRLEAGTEARLALWLAQEQGREFLRRYDPANYASGVAAPLLVRLAAADFFTSPEALAGYWPRLSGPKCLEMVPGSNHTFHDVPASVAWFDRWFGDAPAFPEIRSHSIQAGSTCTVRLDATGGLPITHAEVSWTTSTNDVWRHRQWCSAPLEKSRDGRWEGVFRPAASGAPLRWFASVRDAQGRGASTLQQECVLKRSRRPLPEPVREVSATIRHGSAGDLATAKSLRAVPPIGPAARDSTTLPSENGVLRAVWDDDALHLRFDVRDTSPWRAANEPGARDAVSAAFSFDGEGAPAGRWEIRWTPDADGAAVAAASHRATPQAEAVERPGAPAASVARVNGDKAGLCGYVLAASVPWAFFGEGFRPRRGLAFTCTPRVEFGCCLAPERLAEVSLEARLVLGE